MGLDDVELIMEVEESFGIAFEDEDFPVDTVGELADKIKGKLTKAEERRCLTSHCFYLIRSSMMRLFGIPRSEIKPTTSMEALLSKDSRREAWRQLSADLEARFPDLRLPSWLEQFIVAVGVSVIFAALFAWGRDWISTSEVFCLLIGAGVYFWLGFTTTKPLAVHFPKECATVGGTCKAMLRMNFGKISSERKAWTEEEVWNSLKAIVVEKAWCSPDDVKPETNLYKDLKFG